MAGVPSTTCQLTSTVGVPPSGVSSRVHHRIDLRVDVPLVGVPLARGDHGVVERLGVEHLTPRWPRSWLPPDPQAAEESPLRSALKYRSSSSSVKRVFPRCRTRPAGTGDPRRPSTSTRALPGLGVDDERVRHHLGVQEAHSPGTRSGSRSARSVWKSTRRRIRTGTTRSPSALVDMALRSTSASRPSFPRKSTCATVTRCPSATSRMRSTSFSRPAHRLESFLDAGERDALRCQLRADEGLGVQDALAVERKPGPEAGGVPDLRGRDSARGPSIVDPPDQRLLVHDQHERHAGTGAPVRAPRRPGTGPGARSAFMPALDVPVA